MLKTSVLGSRVNVGTQPQLLDPVKSLEKRMLNDVKQQSGWYLDEPENRVADDFGHVKVSKVG